MRPIAPLDTRDAERSRPPATAWLAWSFCLLVWLLLLLPGLLLPPTHGTDADRDSATITMLRPVVSTALIALPLRTALTLFCLTGWRMIRGHSHQREVASALLVFPLGMVASVARNDLSLGCRWEFAYRLHAPDGGVYFLLHASPPLNGPGHSALAKRTGCGPLHVSMRVLTRFTSRRCPHGKDTRLAARTDPQPEARRAAVTLLGARSRLIPMDAAN